MKLLVLALDAQSGVGAGGKRRLFFAYILRALPNGMENPTLLVWRPDIVQSITFGDSCTNQD